MKYTAPLTFGGKTLTLREWSQEIGITPSTLANRLDRGWTVEQALTNTAPSDIQRKREANCWGCVYWISLGGYRACHYSLTTGRVRGHIDEHGRWVAPVENCPYRR